MNNIELELERAIKYEWERASDEDQYVSSIVQIEIKDASPEEIKEELKTLLDSEDNLSVLRLIQKVEDRDFYEIEFCSAKKNEVVISSDIENNQDTQGGNPGMKL